MSRSIRNFIGTVILIILVFMLVACNTGASFESGDGNATSNETNENVTEKHTVTETVTETDTETETETEVETKIEIETEVETDTETEPPKTDLFDLPIPSGNYALTFDNLNKLGSEHNVVYFVIDRFDWEYYVWARDRAPEIFYNLDEGGFTYYDDAMSLYPRTFPSIAYMITGVKNDFSMSRAKYFESAYSKSEYMRRLYNAGYNINIYTDSYYGYINASYMANYAANAKPVQDAQKAYSTDMRDIYNYITQSGLHIAENEKSYSFIHLSGTHPPQLYDESFNPLPEDSSLVANSTHGMKLSFKIINYYIDEMKRLGVYDNATIIITGDHCSIGSDYDVPLRYAHVTPLFVKPASTADGKLQVSSAPVTHEDVFPTILKSENVTGASDFGKTVFDIPTDEVRERFYYFQKLNTYTNYDMVVFAINGKAADYGNWEIRDRYSLGKSIYS